MKALSLGVACASTILAMSAEDIVTKMAETESVPHSVTRARQVVTTPGGKTREFEIRAFSLDTNEKQLQIYDKPARVRGEKILMLNAGDDIWAYSPKTGRVRHLATHMKKAKVMGSDFAYEDFAAGDYLDRFTVKLLGEEKMAGVQCYKVEMLPTEKGPSYAKEIVWIAKQDFVPRLIEFHDDRGVLKKLRISDVREVDNVLTAWRMTMHNVRDGGNTVIEMLDVDYKTRLDDAMFTQQGLKSKH